jgi:hypothetical protein
MGVYMIEVTVNPPAAEYVEAANHASLFQSSYFWTGVLLLIGFAIYCFLRSAGRK